MTPRAVLQTATFFAYSGMDPADLIHLSKEAGLDFSHYNDLKKLAAGMTVHFYRVEGLEPELRTLLNKHFGEEFIPTL